MRNLRLSLECETDRHDPDAEYKVAEEEEADWQSVGQELQVLGLLGV